MLVSAMSDTQTVMTLVNLGSASRTVIVQGGGYGEHRIEKVELDGHITPVDSAWFTVKLATGAGAKLTLTQHRYASTPTVAFPWLRN